MPISRVCFALEPVSICQEQLDCSKFNMSLFMLQSVKAMLPLTQIGHFNFPCVYHDLSRLSIGYKHNKIHQIHSVTAILSTNSQIRPLK
jgi:hypothetical protein